MRRRKSSELAVIVVGEPDRHLLADWCALATRAVHGDEAPVDISVARRVRPGYEPLYVFVRAGGELLGGVRLLRRRAPGVGWVACAPDLPVFADAGGPRRARVLRRLTETLIALADQHAGLFLQPPDHVSAP